MATDKKRSICKVCGGKSIQDKMIFKNSWYHLSCYDKLIMSCSGRDECPSKLLQKIKKCPYSACVAENYSTPFWIEIRQIAPTTFQDMVFQRHGLTPL